MPFAQDILTRIIDVKWGRKPSFVICTYNGTVYCVSPNSPEDIVVEQPHLPVTGVFPGDRGFFHLSGSSFGKVGAEEAPLFLICGMGSELSGLPAPNFIWRFFSFICASSDGQNWAQAYKGPHGETPEASFIYPWSSESNALVFNPKDGKFYHSMLMVKSTPNVLSQREQIFSSADGTTWTGPITDRSILTADNGGDVFKSDFPKDYCSHNAGFDARKQHVPDGVMSTFSETRTVAMVPTIPPVVEYTGGRAISYWPDVQAGSVEITNDDGQTSKAIPGIAQVTAVGGDGGIWLAGGWNDDSGKSGAIALSFDGGDSWMPGPAIDSGVVTIAWGTIQASSDARL